MEDREMRRSDRRRALHAALDAVLDAGAGASGGVLAEAIGEVGSLRAALDGAMVGILPAFEASMAWAAEGHRTPASWMVAHVGMARAAAAGERRVALAAGRMPHVADAASAGQLSGAHLRLLVEARRAPVEDAFDRDEACLVAQALTLSVDALRRRLDRWYYEVLAELGRNEPDDDPGGSDRNTLRLCRSFRGRGVIDGDLSPEGITTIEAAVAAEVERWRREGTLDADPRTWHELQGDALIALVARGAAGPQGEPVRPLVIAVADVDTLLRRAGASDEERMTRRAEILGAGPVSDATIAELASRAGIALLVTSRGGQPLWFGRTRRLATGAQRAAALAADGDGCYWPGCGAPAHRCQVDHLTGWEQGGATDIENLGMICGYHNRLKHRGGYRASRAPDGSIEVRRSNGERIAPPYAQAS